jgi:hypothetical protein
MTDVRTRYFHEDDYCQQEFLPLSSWDHCASQIQKIDAFAEAHRTEHGWTKMYLRPAAPDPLAKLRLTVSEVAAVAGPVLAPFSKVTTGYGSYVEECPNVHAFGFEHGLTLFAEANGDTPVSALWLNPWGVDPGEAAGVVNVLAGLPRHQELLFVDWAWSRLFKANDRATWLAYLDEHA